MKKKKKLVGLLTAALIVVLLLVVYFGMDFLNPSGPVEENSVTFFEVPMDDIVKVTVIGAEHQYTVEKTEDIWTCAELAGQELDQSEVRYRVNLIDKIPSVRFLGDTGEDLAEYGLKNPRLTIAVTMADGTIHEILVGNLAADDNDYAVLAGDTNVCTILPAIAQVWNIDPTALVVAEESE